MCSTSIPKQSFQGLIQSPWSLEPRRARGTEIDQGTLLQYLSEIMWLSFAAISGYIEWDPIDSSSAKEAMSFKGVSPSAEFYFNEKGKICNTIAERYQYVNGKYTLEKWSTPVQEYGEFNGIKIPVRAEAVWNLDSGEFPFARIEIIDIDYNNPTPLLRNGSDT